MAKFVIEPHFRLQEWVAEEKGYFHAEGLDYEFRELVRATAGKIHDKGDKVGAFQSFEEGCKSNVSCACHWTVNVAASKGHGRMSTDVYSVSPAGIFVAAGSAVKTPTACCSRASSNCSKARRRPSICSAARITSPSSSASAKSSTPRS